MNLHSMANHTEQWLIGRLIPAITTLTNQHDCLTLKTADRADTARSRHGGIEL